MSIRCLSAQSRVDLMMSKQDGLKGVVVDSCLTRSSELNGNNVFDIVKAVWCFDPNQACRSTCATGDGRRFLRVLHFKSVCFCLAQGKATAAPNARYKYS